MIDLSKIPAPDVVQVLDFESTYQTRAAQFAELYPDFAQLLESDPSVEQLELASYQEVQFRARVNDAAKAVMLAFATGADLEQLAAFLGVSRLLLSEADPTANPPVAAVYESDTALRARTQMAMEGTTSAGSRGAYIFHARSASARVRDISLTRPERGVVQVTVLSVDNDGLADDALLSRVEDYLTSDLRRPLTDEVKAVAAELVDFSLQATLHFYPGPSAASVISAAHAALEAYLAEAKLGYDITRSGLFAALHQPGVRQVVLDSPADDLLLSPTQAARCLSRVIEEGGRDV